MPNENKIQTPALVGIAALIVIAIVFLATREPSGKLFLSETGGSLLKG